MPPELDAFLRTLPFLVLNIITLAFTFATKEVPGQKKFLLIVVLVLIEVVLFLAFLH